MSIESARLVVESTKRDGIGGAAPPPVCIRIFGRDPRTVKIYFDGTGAVDTTPGCTGQIVAYQDPAVPNFVNLLICYDKNDLNNPWKPVNLSFLLDSRTGRTHDPNAGFYNPLAS